MFDLSQQIKGYQPERPLIESREAQPGFEGFVSNTLGMTGGQNFDRKTFTPDIQKNMINSHFGNAPESVQNNTPIANEPIGMPPEELARLKRLDDLVSKPEILKAIGDVILGQNVPIRPNEPVAAQPVVPQAVQVSEPNAPVQPAPVSGENQEADDFLKKMWNDMGDPNAAPPSNSKENVDIVENVARQMPTPQPAPVVQQPVEPQYNEMQRTMIGAAAREGISAQDFDSFMAQLKPEDFVQLYKANNGQSINQPQVVQQQAPPAQPLPNLSEVNGRANVPVYMNRFGTGDDVDKFQF